jgi:hypothetical protein
MLYVCITTTPSSPLSQPPSYVELVETLHWRVTKLAPYYFGTEGGVEYQVRYSTRVRHHYIMDSVFQHVRVVPGSLWHTIQYFQHSFHPYVVR